MKNKTLETKRGRRILGRTLIVLAALATLVAAFYTEEDWRGKRAWENAKREIEARGVVLDWNALIPPPVPDDENFFAAPKMQEWFVKVTDWHHPLTNDLTERLKNPDTVATITNAAAAEKYLAWSDQFEPDFDLTPLYILKQLILQRRNLQVQTWMYLHYILKQHLPLVY